MTQYLIKVLVSAGVVVAVSELSKRNTVAGGLLASLPLVSMLAMVWLFLDTKDSAKVAVLSTSIFWLVLPSLVFFLVLPALLKWKMNFYLSFSLAVTIMLACYGLMFIGLRRFGVNL